MDSQDKILQYAPFSSDVAPAFWHNLSQLKLDVDRLNEHSRNIWGYYSASDPPGFDFSLSVDFSAFNRDFIVDATSLPAHGVLVNKNTLDSFKECHKMDLLQNNGLELWKQINDGTALENPSLLNKFILLTYADLKKYKFYYWFAFIAQKATTTFVVKPAVKILEVFSSDQVECLEKIHSNINDPRERSFYVVTLSALGKMSVLPLKEYGDAYSNKNQRTFICFSDPSNLSENPGWPLRNMMALVACKWRHLTGSNLEVIGVRRKFDGTGWNCSSSVLFTLMIGKEEKIVENQIEWIGWERNARGMFGPRMTDLGATMDPLRLAETSVDLNLKLMKWRLMPELDLDIVKNSRILLLGAGTLGCSVARLLLGWGTRSITFVDNGLVSYSNPVRQILYTFNDCKNGGKLKVDAAAEALKAIFPGVESKGVKLSIPMPGHPVGDSTKAEVMKAVEQLEELIKSSDVIFLLTDTRESRWLPTLLAACHGKLAINAALGYDTFLVMRHGLRSACESNSTAEMTTDFSSKTIDGNQLGCYFCNDVVAPGNSTKDRTLDQQCTVTRPGISMLASGLAVELAVSVLQHPLKGNAPAYCSAGSIPMATGGRDEEEFLSPLGIVPHSIRGFLSQFQQVLPATHCFSHCVACSPKVIQEYLTRKFDFLCQVFDNPGYLEDLTGLTEMHQESAFLEVWELSDSESGAME